MDNLRNILSKLLNIIKLLYTPISLIFIGYFAYLNKELLIKLLYVADWHFIFFAVFFWCLLHLLSPISPKILLLLLGSSISYLDLLSIHITRLPARYLPGGIWHTVGRLSDYYSRGVSKKSLTFLALIETFSPGIISLFLGGGYLWLSEEKNILASVEGILALLNFVILVITPLIVKWQIPSSWNKNFLLSYLFFLLISGCFWLIASVSFLFYYTSLSLDADQISLFQVAATYIFAWGIGYISVFAPQGIGVFEVVAGKLLPLPITLGGAVALVAGFRIVGLVADCVVWLLYRFFQFTFTRRKEKIIHK